MARQCSQVPDYFRKNAADRPKKGSGTIGTKTFLSEMAALGFISSILPCSVVVDNL